MSFENIPEFLNPLFWLSTQPLNVTGTPGRIVFVVFVLVFVLGVVSRAVSRKKPDKFIRLAYSRMAAMLTTMGLLGGFLYLLSFERIQFFGGRLLYILWLITLIIWMFAILRFVKKDAPRMRKEAHDRKEKRKYLPGQKKKKER